MINSLCPSCRRTNGNYPVTVVFSNFHGKLFPLVGNFLLAILEREATLIFVIKSLIKYSTSWGDVRSGLLKNSTAPAFRASKTAPLVLLIIITGSGCCGSSRLINSMPFIFGICKSQVITSGLKSIILSRASKGSTAVATTSISLSAEIPLVINSRKTRLSSTTSTFIFLVQTKLALSPVILWILWLVFRFSCKQQV